MTIKETGEAIALEIKDVGPDGTFSGYASTFGNVDRGRDVVVAGAFTKSLKARPAGKVKMLFQHRPDEVIGVWDSIEQDAKGLKVSGRLLLDIARAKDVHTAMVAGAYDTLSIGYRTVTDRIDRTKGVRFLEEVDLHEISVVTFGMNESATVSRVKSHNDFAALVAAINGARAALN